MEHRPRRQSFGQSAQCAVLCVSFLFESASAKCAEATRSITAENSPKDSGSSASPIDSLGDDIGVAFTGTRLIYYAAAVVSTAVLSPTGGDHAIRVAVQENLHAPLWGDVAYYAGYTLPIAVPLGLYLSGIGAHQRSIAGAGSAALQALGITVVTTTVLKIATGRPFPLHGGDPNAQDRLDHPEYAREFVPFGFAGRYAWPSGHTSASISVAAALTAYASDSLVVPLVSYTVASGIGIGMVVGDRHFASDVIAGALIGQAIGWSVGSAFREREDRRTPRATQIRLVPLLGNVRGCALTGTL